MKSGFIVLLTYLYNSKYLNMVKGTNQKTRIDWIKICLKVDGKTLSQS
jgi:hypothetical protein